MPIEYDEKGMLKFPKSWKKETKTERRERLRKQRKDRFNKYQEESKITATKFGTTYEDEELEKILECESKDYDKMLELAKKFKRTWWAIKTIIEDRDYYFKHRVMKKTLWMHPKNDSEKLDGFGNQLKRILENNQDWFKTFVIESKKEKSIYKF